MGKLVEEIAKKRGHEISCVIDIDDQELYSSKKFRESDVAIAFTVPQAAVDGILSCFTAKVPVVVGTTGWTNSLPELKSMCEKGAGTMLYSSNFSIGMNIFKSLNRYMGKIMNDFDSYKPYIGEVHHIHKLDHPSGSAITLAEELIKVFRGIKGWFEPTDSQSHMEGYLPIYHKRDGEVPGIHTVVWESENDTISLTHSAKSRNGFAAGAVSAAEWLAGKNGFFTIGDFLSDITGTSGLFE